MCSSDLDFVVAHCHENNGGEDNKYDRNLSYFCFMEINSATVDKLASLSKLEFSAEEKTELIGDLQNMLNFVNVLQSLDTKDIEPLLHISSNQNVFREDVVLNQISSSEALSNARLKDEQFFKVPKVIKKS